MPFDSGFDPRELLTTLANSSWVRQVGLLLAATLVSWPLAHAVARWMGTTADGERRELGLLRALARASLWPVFALGTSAIVLEVLRSAAPHILGEGRDVLPILVFFLVWRLINTLLLELVPKGRLRTRTRRVLVPLLFVLLVLQQLGLLGPMLDFLRRPLITLGGANLTVFAFLVAALAFTAVSVVARIAQAFFGHALLPRMGVELPMAEAIGTVVRYALVVIGMMWGLEILGFDLTTLKIGLGALGIGIGFGLQNIVNNFTSGLILLFERSVKRGDVLTVDGTDGRVQRIGLRSSVIRTRAGEDLILPNSILVENMVTNYSFGDELKRVDVEVGVSYDSDPQVVHDLLVEVGRRAEDVLQEPPPSALFLAFGESSLNFQLRVWIADAWVYPTVSSRLHFDVWYALKEAGIVIPFPQRDVHLRGGAPPRLSPGEQDEGRRA